MMYGFPSIWKEGWVIVAGCLWVATGLPHAGDEIPPGERVFLTGAKATSLIVGASVPLAPPEPQQ